MTGVKSRLTPEVITFGCRLNAYESEVIRQNAHAIGLSDTVIVNTCAVTREAERQARQAIRRARKMRPTSHIIVTGCAAQLAPHSFEAMPEVDSVLGNKDKLKPEKLSPRSKPIQAHQLSSIEETSGHLIGKSGAFSGRARAFLQVQNGCDHRCTFCIIPYTRGPSRSVPLNSVITEARHLAGNAPEIVLTGVDIGAYGMDLKDKPPLSQLIREILFHVPELKRLRLSSIDPIDVDEDLLTLYGNESRLMPHLHLSIQAGDDIILKRMKRRHTTAYVRDLCAKARARRSDIVFGADLIAGFPTESETMFENTLSHVKSCGFTFLHVFPYSERPGTPAERMPTVPVSVRKLRARHLRTAGTAARQQFFSSCLGSVAEVVLESGTVGRTEQFVEVQLTWPNGVVPESAGSLAMISITGHNGDALIGQVIL